MNKCVGLLAVVAASGLFSVAQVGAAILPVSSYSMYDYSAANGYSYGYSDESYTGGTYANGFRSGGKGDLVNGIKSTVVNSGYWEWAPYVLWDGYDPTITFDLGSVTAVGNITTYALAFKNAAVYIPHRARIAFSTDGTNFTAPIERVFTAAERFDAPYSARSLGVYNLLPESFSAQARFVKVDYILDSGGENRWMAIDEIQISSPIPEPTPALALTLPAAALLARRRRV